MKSGERVLTLDELNNEIELQRKRNELSLLKSNNSFVGFLTGIVRILENPSLLIISIIAFLFGLFIGMGKI